MKNKILQSLILVAMACFSSLNAQIKIATFQSEDEIDFARITGWKFSDVDTVANPAVDNVNPSDTCLKFIKSSRYNSSLQWTQFKEPINLAEYNELEFKILTTNAPKGNVQVILTDIFGKEISKSFPAPEETYVWQLIKLDFEELLSSTPISYIKEMQFRLNYDTDTVYLEDGTMKLDDMYLDDIRMAGRGALLSEYNIVTMYKESINKNYHNQYTGTIGGLVVYHAKGFIMRGGMEHYNVDDSIRCDIVNGIPQTHDDARFLILEPLATSEGLNSLFIKQVVAGKDNVNFRLRFRWDGTPKGGLGVVAPTVKISYDRTNWTDIYTTSVLPGDGSSAIIDYQIGAPEIGNDTLFLRVSNGEDVRLRINELTLEGTLIFADDIEVSGPKSIPTDSGQIQLTSKVSPAGADQTTYWYIIEGGDSATIDHFTGVLTAKGSGPVTVMAWAVDKKGEAYTTYEVNLNTGISDINDVEQSEVKLYPNPMNDMLNIEAPTNLSELRIFSLSGQLVQTVNTGFDQVDVSTLNAGVYFVELQLGNQTVTQKIIKK